MKPQFVPVCFMELVVLVRYTHRKQMVRDVTERTVSPPDVMSSFPAAVSAREPKWSEICWREAKRKPSSYIWTKPLICSQSSVSYHKPAHRTESETIQKLCYFIFSCVIHRFKVESELMPNKLSLAKRYILTAVDSNKNLDSFIPKKIPKLCNLLTINKAW